MTMFPRFSSLFDLITDGVLLWKASTNRVSLLTMLLSLSIVVEATPSPTPAPIVTLDDVQNTTDAGAVPQSYIYIQESYSDVPLDLSVVNWQLFLIILFSILSSISIILYILQFHHAIHYTNNRMGKNRMQSITHHNYHTFDTIYYSSNDDITATEHIYKLFHDNGVHQHIIDIIIKDFCGYRNPPTLNAIIALKQQIRTKRRDTYCRIGCKLFVSHLVVITLIASLLCATYCGIIFVIQNDNHLNKYSTFVGCQCIDIDDLCQVHDHAPWSFYIEATYDSFYDEILIPYIEKYEPSLINHFESGNSLYLTSTNWCNGEYLYETGWLYLSQEGLTDSDFLSNSNGCMCYENDDEPCCSCCQGWVVFAVVCLILLMLILLTALVYIDSRIFIIQVLHGFIIEEIEYLMKDIQRIINEIDNIDQLWQS